MLYLNMQIKNYREINLTNLIKLLDRTIEDVEWFIKKFDYRYKDEPWKNSKDALVRTLCKTNGVTDEE